MVKEISRRRINGRMPNRPRIGWIYECLPCGKENAIPGRDLANILGIQELRNLTVLIERERRSGLAICAALGKRGQGYYKAATPEELEEYLESLNRRANNYRCTIELLTNALAEWRGQETLWGEDDV